MNWKFILPIPGIALEILHSKLWLQNTNINNHCPVTYPKSLCLFNFKPLFYFLNAKDPATVFCSSSRKFYIYYNFIFLLYFFLSLKFNATTFIYISLHICCLLLFRCSCLVTLWSYFPVFSWIDSGSTRMVEKNCGYLDLFNIHRTRFRIHFIFSHNFSISFSVFLSFFTFNKCCHNQHY